MDIKNQQILITAGICLILTLSGCSSNLARKVSEGAYVSLETQDFSQYMANNYCRFLEIRALLNNEIEPKVLMESVDSKEKNKCRVSKRDINSSNIAEELTNFLGSGYAYVDLRCEQYFDNLHRFYKKKREDVNASNVVTGALGGILAAIQASAKSIALVAIGGTSTTASIENYGSSLLFELDPSATQGLVLKAQKAFQAEVASRNVTQSFPETLAAVSEYARLCLPPRIEKLVTEAVRSADPKDLSSEKPSEVTNRSLMGAVGKTLRLSRPLTTEEEQLLYALLVLRDDQDIETLQLIKAKLANDLHSVLFNGDDLLASDDVAVARSVLTQMDEGFRQKSADALALLKPAVADVSPSTNAAASESNTATNVVINEELKDMLKEALAQKGLSTTQTLALAAAVDGNYESLSASVKARISRDLGSDITNKVFDTVGKPNLLMTNKLAKAFQAKSNLAGAAKIYQERLNAESETLRARKIQTKIQPLPNIGVK
jgi:hypothetical protein